MTVSKFKFEAKNTSISVNIIPEKQIRRLQVKTT